MANSNRAVTGREYKLMLQPTCFRRRDEGIKELRSLLKRTMQNCDGKQVKKAGDEDLREVWYLDSKDLLLRRSGFALRARIRRDKKKPFELTLRFRSQDRYISAAQAMSCDGGDEEFEQDISVPFTSVYSNSCRIRKSEMPELSDISDLQDYFELPKVLSRKKRSKLKIVRDLRVREYRRKLGRFAFDDDDRVEASVAIWYLASGDSEPLVVELDLDVESEIGEDNELEEFRLSEVQGANCVFTKLVKADSWVVRSPTSKTAFAYGAR